MVDVESLVQRFVAVWNEQDARIRRATIEALWVPEGRHLMCSQDVQGYDALAERVAASHDRSVVQGGNIFRPATAVQTLADVVKFRWEMARRSNGEVVSAGVGILKLNPEGRITCDYLFTEF
ncbi:MAG: hypothetical protein ABL973_07045 [Micropepsaceae bacterium]